LAITFNFIALAATFVHLSLAIKRDSFLIDHLDKDPQKSYYFLQLVLQKYQKTKRELLYQNWRLFTSGLVVLPILLLNSFCSAVVIASQYADYTTITVFCTNTFWLFVEMLKHLRLTCQNDFLGGVSCLLNEPVRYNTIDKDLANEQVQLQLEEEYKRTDKDE